MSTIVEVADAMVASLNGASFSQPFTAVRSYLPAVELAELKDLHVTVIPKSEAITVATRESDYFEPVIDVGIQKKVDPNDAAQMDAMCDLVQEIIDHLRHRRLEAMPDAAWLSIEHEPVFAPEHLDQERVFTSVLSVTYRLRR